MKNLVFKLRQYQGCSMEISMSYMNAFKIRNAQRLGPNDSWLILMFKSPNFRYESFSFIEKKIQINITLSVEITRKKFIATAKRNNPFRNGISEATFSSVILLLLSIETAYAMHSISVIKRKKYQMIYYSFGIVMDKQSFFFSFCCRIQILQR